MARPRKQAEDKRTLIGARFDPYFRGQISARAANEGVSCGAYVEKLVIAALTMNPNEVSLAYAEAMLGRATEAFNDAFVAVRFKCHEK